MSDLDERRKDPMLQAARDGWGVTVRYFLIRHGRSLLRWTGAGLTSTVAAAIAWVLQHR